MTRQRDSNPRRWFIREGRMKMGLYKIDNVSSEEWDRRMMRRHSRIRWMITLAEIAALAGAIWMVIWLWNWVGI